ncbi:MAG: peptide deformylase [Oscillospiraceae bacterium]|nr:peptide deformylase [Oscillospiraceae bacterium]
MAIRNIVKDGDPILKKVCRPVTDFNEKLATLLEDMGETMIAANGLGLAGPQVGMMRRVFVVLDQYLDDDDNEVEEIIEFVNPEILETSEETITSFEGCLSFPGRNGLITRPAYVRAQAQDRYGEWFEIEAEGLLARAILHENDHLNGTTVLDNANIFYEDLTAEQLQEIQQREDYE